ncbi:hypothetical protein HAX54_046214 [Datura stramonium]|uniref:Uncharacterized protein n=1 Tax=Datura stramonium TaxID=4076 RepID=A0ABS8WKI7_DATST|nr:hypothetical protein [Datura stramonium]
MPINFGAVLRDKMRLSRENIQWRYYYCSLLTHFLQQHDIEEEEADLRLTLARHLVDKMIDLMGPAFSEPLDDDEPILLADEVDEGYDADVATTTMMMLDDANEVDGCDFVYNDADDS